MNVSTLLLAFMGIAVIGAGDVEVLALQQIQLVVDHTKDLSAKHDSDAEFPDPERPWMSRMGLIDLASDEAYLRDIDNEHWFVSSLMGKPWMFWSKIARYMWENHEAEVPEGVELLDRRGTVWLIERETGVAISHEDIGWYALRLARVMDRFVPFDQDAW